MFKNIKNFFLCLLFLPILAFAQQEKKADLVAYSFDRPLQLYAFLESLDYYVTGLGDVIVIYRSSNDEFEKAYTEIKEFFPSIVFWKQGSNPAADFKPLTLKATFDSPHDYILFGVDDTVVKDFIDVSESIEQLEKYNAYGFYFRQGLHLTKSYTGNCMQPLPPYKTLEEDLYSWHFNEGKCNWHYPNSVDMTLYRKKDIEGVLRKLKYKAPNTFEGSWALTALHTVMHKTGLCTKISKVINLPINKVQTENSNRHMNSYDTYELLSMFNNDLKMDILPLFRVKNESGHCEYLLTFVKK